MPGPDRSAAGPMKAQVSWAIIGAIAFLALLYGFDKISKAATAELRADLATADSIHTAERDTLMQILKDNRVVMDSLRTEVADASVETQVAVTATDGSFSELRAAVPPGLVPLVDAAEQRVIEERAAHQRELTLARAQRDAETIRADGLQSAYDAAIGAWEAEERLRKKLEPGPNLFGIELGDLPGLGLAYIAGRSMK